MTKWDLFQVYKPIQYFKKSTTVIHHRASLEAQH